MYRQLTGPLLTVLLIELVFGEQLFGECMFGKQMFVERMFYTALLCEQMFEGVPVSHIVGLKVAIQNFIRFESKV